MNYREKLRKAVECPQFGNINYGEYGALRLDQRKNIKRLLDEMDRADEVVKHQFFEIERLNNNWNELEKYTKKEIKKWKEEEKTENDYSARANILGYITGMENVQDKIQKFKGVVKK